MFNIRLKRPDGVEVIVPYAVNNLAECREVVKRLDEELESGTLPTWAQFYSRDTEVRAIDESNNESYDYHDQDPSGHSDGIWSYRLTIGAVLQHKKGPPVVTRTWMGGVPTECQLCHVPLTTTFIDGKTRFGPWAIMCPACHRDQAFGLGVGRGQAYQLDTLQKIGG